MTTTSPSLCAVTAGGPHPWIIINALGRHFGPIDVVLEDPEPLLPFLARRGRKTGWISLAGQFATMVFIRVGKRLLSRRIAAIVAAEGLETEPRPEHSITRIDSVNSEEFVQKVQALAPQLVLFAGCRMAKPDILARMPCPVLNYHAGITPNYRGMNGGYWALACDDPGNFGATLHLVDGGVDTGGILCHVRAEPSPGDNIMIYPYRLAARSRESCVDTVGRVLNGEIRILPATGESKQWYHPTIWSYLWTGIIKGVW